MASPLDPEMTLAGAVVCLPSSASLVLDGRAGRSSANEQPWDWAAREPLMKRLPEQADISRQTSGLSE
jgi:hypothetical protein